MGRRLVERLQAEGHQVVVFVRDATKLAQIFPASRFPRVESVAYTPKESGAWQKSISGCHGVVNLAGEPLFGDRWTPERKQEIVASRELGTQKLVEAIAQAEAKPQVLVNASAVGFYGTSETAIFDETSPPGNDFLAHVCQAWETQAEKVKQANTRLVILRFGIVLGMGGAISQMITPFRLFAGGPIGTGRQWFSWIHREDLVSLIIQSLTDSDVEGILNATAPNPVRMAEFCQTLGQVLQRPSWLPVPGFALELLLGDAAKVILEGQNVQPRRTQDYGFQFQYPTVDAALREILTTPVKT